MHVIHARVCAKAHTDLVLNPFATAQSVQGHGFTMHRMHHFRHLFAQLGLPDHPEGIVHFLTVHAAMAEGMRLPDAPYWTISQAAFLREALMQDSDWTDMVDQLSLALRLAPPATVTS